MRILMLTDFYPPFIGGLERHVQTLSRELVKRGHSVSIVTLWQDDLPSCDIDQGVRVHRITGWMRALDRFYTTPGRHFHPTVPDPGVARALRRILRAELPDIIHTHTWMQYSMLPLKRWSGALVVHTAHDYALTCVKQSYMFDGSVCSGPAYLKCIRCAGEQYGTLRSAAMTSGLRASSRLHSQVDHYLAISTFVAEVTKAAMSGRPFSVVPTFIPDDVLQRARAVDRPAFLPDDDGYLLFVGALGAYKGVDVLLEAYGSLRNPPPLVLIGTPRHEKTRPMPRGVKIVANVPHAEVMRSWLGCSIGLVPSVWAEPLGQVAVEAMAAGRPVVASAIGGLKDIVKHGETGLLVDPGDAGQLARAIETLLSDAAMAGLMGREGARRAQRFMISNVVEDIEGIYRDLIRGAS